MTAPAGSGLSGTRNSFVTVGSSGTSSQAAASQHRRRRQFLVLDVDDFRGAMVVMYLLSGRGDHRVSLSAFFVMGLIVRFGG